MHFENLFAQATGFSPYPYQIALAESNKWPKLINIETGLGKTYAIILAWLYKRRYSSQDIRSSTPRRLIICLPTRVLVEQTYSSAKTILENIGQYSPLDNKLGDQDGVALSLLWGGEVDNDIDRFPERDMIIVGTQDMLLSRALNRGYAMSKYRWPTHFAILNNDCLWVMDEVQLMGPGLQTSAQLEAFRSSMGTIGIHHTIWMSATMDNKGISTVDHPLEPLESISLNLGEEDRGHIHVSSLLEAKKEVRISPIVIDKDEKKNIKSLASRIMEVHEPGTLTLIIVNTVSRARGIFSELKKTENPSPIILLHSHFRPSDRSTQYERIKQCEDAIVVTTQVVEAGADISAKCLITDLAPWPSMVQRFGRCNRRGEHTRAVIEWIDSGINLEPKGALPYNVDDLLTSRQFLLTLTDGSPSSLKKIEVRMEPRIVPVIRRKDLLDLFDTTPDLLGNELDISRFIRANESTDVFLYWREFEEQPSDDSLSPSPLELCSVPINEFLKYLDKDEAWNWNHVTGRWNKITKSDARAIRPGQVLLIDRKKGGYSSTRGWTGSEKDIPDIIEVGESLKTESLADDSHSDTFWIELKEHTADVVSEVLALRNTYPSEYKYVLEEAARWHDVGKAHEAFQNVLRRGGGREGKIWGKGQRDPGTQYFTLAADGRKVLRPYFRHELASALSFMAKNAGKPSFELITYLIASHHGKVRMSLRSVPSEGGPDDETLFARGVWHGDRIHFPEMFEEDVTLDLSPIRLGPVSWVNMAIGLRDNHELGPFRLAYLETILRVADWRASEKETSR